MSLRLSARDRAMLEGEAGAGPAEAMTIVTELARWLGAERLLDIQMAHVDGCIYTGIAGVEFAERLAAWGTEVSVSTTLNVSSIDLLHPDLYRGDAGTAALARRQMDAYVAMGCRPTWTCAPYQLATRPHLGQQIAWGESNAIVFANSVLGARTERYGDFADIACAVTGRAPAAGLHLDAPRRATLIVDVAGVPASWFGDDVGFAVLGHWLGATVGGSVPVVTGLDHAGEDQLKVLGAAAASSGSVAMFHIAGVTPEAPTVAAATGGAPDVPVVEVTQAALRRARESLRFSPGDRLGAVSLGTPHYSAAQLRHVAELLAGRRVAVPTYVSTGRDTAAAAQAAIEALEQAGVTVVTDTCTYVTPIIDGVEGAVMTDSAKWAYYAPGNIGAAVEFGSMADCVESAITGHIIVAPW